MKKILSILTVLALLLAGIGILYSRANQVVSAQADTCPDGGAWTKIDSDDLSLYPVEGAVEYCFKAGPYLFDEIPPGGFGQDGPCSEENPQNCGLSHWAYRMGEPSPTPTDPPEDPSPTPTDPPEDPTPTPTDPPEDPTPTPTDTPEDPTPTPTDPPTQPTPVQVITDPELGASNIPLLLGAIALLGGGSIGFFLLKKKIK